MPPLLKFSTASGTAGHCATVILASRHTCTKLESTDCNVAMHLVSKLNSATHIKFLQGAYSITLNDSNNTVSVEQLQEILKLRQKSEAMPRMSACLTGCQMNHY